MTDVIDPTICLDEFISKYVITSQAYLAADNPNCPDWKNARHWTVHIYRMGIDGAMVVPFSQGLAHKEKPTTADVLDCIAMDCLSYEEAEGDFGAWADEMDCGDEEKPSSLWRTFNAIGRHAVALEKLLGVGLYRELLYRVERL